MKLLQLRYIWEISKNNFNISATAEKLSTSQPGISKHVRQLEDELGVEIFERKGKQLIQATPTGAELIKYAGSILSDVTNIKNIALDYQDTSRGSLVLATTHTQARYVLPSIIKKFISLYPHIKLNIRQGTPSQIAKMAAKREVDIAIATEAMELFENLVMLPCYRWNRSIIFPKSHPLNNEKRLTLDQIAKHPIVTYDFGFTGRSALDRAFATSELEPNIALTAVDTDVIKTYVRLGLGVGIIASLAYEDKNDSDLVARDASHLFDYSITKIGFCRSVNLRKYTYDFIEMFATHLDRNTVDTYIQNNGKALKIDYESLPTF